jgi:endo-1,4-beta-mannosidase
MSQPFTLGVNYWPRRKAMYWWSNFERAEVEEEFAVIRDLGLKVVRIFLLWDDWQPTPDTVSAECLRNIEIVADIAVANNLGLDVTFFTGHMSGPNWSPRWLLGGSIAPEGRQIVSEHRIVNQGYRNPYSDSIALNAECLLLSTVVTRLRDHPGVWMWNLGNEPDLFAWPDTDAQGQAWVREMTSLIKSIDPTHPVTCGLHNANLVQSNHLRIDQVYAETDIAVMHTYPMYSMPISRSNLDTDYVPFACAVTAALAGKPCLMEEFGGCTAPPGQASFVAEWELLGKPRQQFMASEEDLAAFIKDTLDNLLENGTTGAMLWCYADYTPDLYDRPPCNEYRHERTFGLVRPDGSIKPHAKVIQAFAATNPIVRPIPNWAKLKIDGDAYYQSPRDSLIALYPQYLTQKESAR